MNPRLLAEQLIAEQPVEIRMEGFSMYPTLRAGDRAVVQRCENAAKIRKGDLVAFRLGENSLICHRIVKIEKTANGIIFTSRGDNNAFCDYPFSAEDIFGIIVACKHQNKKTGINSFRMKLMRFSFLYFSRIARKVIRISDIITRYFKPES